MVRKFLVGLIAIAGLSVWNPGAAIAGNKCVDGYNEIGRIGRDLICGGVEEGNHTAIFWREDVAIMYMAAEEFTAYIIHDYSTGQKGQIILFRGDLELTKKANAIADIALLTKYELYTDLVSSALWRSIRLNAGTTRQ